MSSSKEYSSVKKAEKKRNNALSPVIGVIVIVIAGALAWFGAEPVFNWLLLNVPGIPAEPALQYVVMGVIFLLVVLLGGLFYSIVAPKPPKGISERDMDREKQRKAAEEQAAKRRKAEMRAKMRQRNRR